MELNQALKRVRQLIEKAEGSNNNPPGSPEYIALQQEQETARAMADALMLQYAIEEAELDKTRTATFRARPGVIEVALTGEYELVGYVADMASYVARTCRCKIRHYTRHFEGAWQSKVYGFESDLRYFEIMYTTLRLHMIGALDPKPDPAKSIEDNAYALHNAGLNWYDIAQAYGWREVTPESGEARYMYQHRTTGERQGWSQAVAKYRSAYKRAVTSRGESEVRIPPGGRKTFRSSAAQGYVRRIAQRLRELEHGRESGAALVLASREDDLEKFFRELNPDLYKERVYERCEACEKAASGHCRAHRPLKYVPAPFSRSAYEVGVNHANGANLNPATSPKITRSIDASTSAD